MRKLINAYAETVTKIIPKNSVHCIIACTQDTQRLSKLSKGFQEILVDGGIIAVAISPTYKDIGIKSQPFAIPLIFKMTLLDCIVIKNNMIPDAYHQSESFVSYTHHNSYKFLYILSKGKPKTFNLFKESNIWSCDEEAIVDLPDHIAEDLILTYTNKKDIIYIPFNDNGKIAKVAEANNRYWIFSDIPKYSLDDIKTFIKRGPLSFDLTKGKTSEIKNKIITDTQQSFYINKHSNRLNVSYSDFLTLPSEEKKKILYENFLYYRKHGYPFYTASLTKKKRDLAKLAKLDTSTLITNKNNVIKRVTTGLSVANSYMLHMYKVVCHGYKSPYEAFMDDNLLLIAVKKAIELNGRINNANLRGALRWVTGTQMVSNFRPSVAKYIYDNYSGYGKVLDFSCGFGGRLIGAIASNKVHKYVGTDPCVPTYKGLLKIKEELNTNKEIVIYNSAFEDLKLKEKFDLAFSSPPYFHQEKYGDEEGQSYIRYPTVNEWRDKFLKAVIKNCYKYLKKDGYFILNICNTVSYKTFEQDALDIAEEAGFTLFKTYLMSLTRLFSPIAFKFEPIFVFKK